MTIKQGTLINSMKQLGYQVDEGGMCFGISAMAEQACLAEETDKFLTRLENITKHDKDPVKYVEDLKTRQLDKHKKTQEKHKKTQEPLYKFVHAFITPKPPSAPDVVTAADVSAFLDGVALLMDPKKYSTELQQFNSTTTVTSPDKGSRGSDFLDTKDLDLNTATGVQFSRPFQTLVSPISIKEKINTNLLCTGSYNAADIQAQLKHIITTFGDVPFALSICSQNHATSVLYNPTTKPKLFFFNPNAMPTLEEKAQLANEENNNPETYLNDIASKIENAFDEKPPILSIEIRAKNTPDFSNNTQRLQTNTEWNKLNEKCISTNIPKIFELAFFNGDSQTCNAIIDKIDKSGGDVHWILKEQQNILNIIRNNLDPKNYISSLHTLQSLNIKVLARDNKPTIDPTKLRATIKLDGLALYQATPEMKDDPQLVLAAYRNNKNALKFASSKAVVSLVNNDQLNLNDIQNLDKFKNDVEVMYAYYYKYPLTIMYATENVKQLIKSGTYGLQQTTMFKRVETNYWANQNSISDLKEDVLTKLFEKYSALLPEATKSYRI